MIGQSNRDYHLINIDIIIFTIIILIVNIVIVIIIIRMNECCIHEDTLTLNLHSRILFQKYFKKSIFVYLILAKVPSSLYHVKLRVISRFLFSNIIFFFGGGHINFTIRDLFIWRPTQFCHT